MQPLGDNVLIKLDKDETITESGIHIPETTDKKKKSEGIIVAVFSDCEEVKEGDRVLFRKWQGEEIIIEGEPYILISLKEVLAIYA